MSNMSYCRFQNTLPDLNDCTESIQNQDSLSREEAEAARDMASACEEFLAAFKEYGLVEDEDEDEDEDDDS